MKKTTKAIWMIVLVIGMLACAGCTRKADYENDIDECLDMKPWAIGFKDGDWEPSVKKIEKLVEKMDMCTEEGNAVKAQYEAKAELLADRFTIDYNNDLSEEEYASELEKYYDKEKKVLEELTELKWNLYEKAKKRRVDEDLLEEFQFSIEVEIYEQDLTYLSNYYDAFRDGREFDSDELELNTKEGKKLKKIVEKVIEANTAPAEYREELIQVLEDLLEAFEDRDANAFMLDYLENLLEDVKEL